MKKNRKTLLSFKMINGFKIMIHIHHCVCMDAQKHKDPINLVQQEIEISYVCHSIFDSQFSWLKNALIPQA